MRLLEVERRARRMGIKDTWRYSKEELIRAIQNAEGNNPCYSGGRRKEPCDQVQCCWRLDCLR